ncbi:MAG: hypothetical protein ACOH5I_25260 [Oligoflexus sp.]
MISITALANDERVTTMQMDFDDLTEGYVFQYGKAELGFRFDEGPSLIITWCRRLNQQSSLRNPFHELEWFILFLAVHDPQLKRVKGLVGIDDSINLKWLLPNHRLSRFYKKKFAWSNS